MTLKKYINERFIDNDKKSFVLYEHSHPSFYILKDKKNNLEYYLIVKKTGNNLFYYADEIINQGYAKYIYYKRAYSHYCIRNIESNKEWEIPKKETCIEICAELNSLCNNIHS